MKGSRNDLGYLRQLREVDRVWNRKDGVTVVIFHDGTAMRIPPMTSFQAIKEAQRLELRAEVIRAVNLNRKEGV